MPTTQAQAALMRSTAATFDSVNQGLESMLRRLMDELDVLRTRWQGAGGRSFEQVRQRWAVDQRALNRALAETAEAIRTAGQRYDASDVVAAGRLGDAGHRGLSLPL